jgi:hypothetical protein
MNDVKKPSKTKGFLGPVGFSRRRRASEAGNASKARRRLMLSRSGLVVFRHICHRNRPFGNMLFT